MNQIKNNVEAINILIQAAIKGQANGAFTLGEASTLNEAITFLSTPAGKPSEEFIEDKEKEPNLKKA